SLPRNKVPFPGLIQYYQSLVPLHVDDLPTLSEQLNEPDRRKLFEQAYENLRQRLLARLQAGGDGKPGPIPLDREKRLTAEELKGEYRTLDKRMNDMEYLRLNNWKKQAGERGGPRGPVLVVVSVTGGASRSAYWTTLVLNRLEQEWK